MLRVNPEEVKAVEWARDECGESPSSIEAHAALAKLSRRLREDLDLMLTMLGNTSIQESDAEVYMDGDMRHTMFSWRPLLALEENDTELVLPWYFLKEAVAQILNYEVWQDEVRCQAEGKELPHGLQHKKLAAKLILEEARVEKEAFIAKARGVAPSPKIQVPGVDF